MLFARRTELEVKAQAVQSENLGRAGDNSTVAKLEFIQCPRVTLTADQDNPDHVVELLSRS